MSHLASHRCILGNVLGRLMARRADAFAGTSMRVNICTFDCKHWEGIVQSIIWGLARGGCVVDWELTNEGILHMWLHHELTHTREHKTIVVMCKLSGTESDRILKIMAKFPDTNEVYVHALGVTSDGLWIGSPRRYYDEVNHSGLESDELNTLAVGVDISYTNKVVYNTTHFFT